MKALSTLLKSRLSRFAGLLLINLVIFGVLIFRPDFVKDAAHSSPEDGGDTCPAATFISALPYLDSGTTVSKVDNYDLPPDVTDPTCTAPVAWKVGGGTEGGKIYTGTGTGPDAAYLLKMDETCRVQVDMDPTSTQDLALIVYLAQCTSSLADCVVVDDTNVAGGTETVQFEAAAETEYFIVVDGYSTGGTPPGPSGPFNLSVSEITSPLTGCQPVGTRHPEIEVADGGTDIPDGYGTLDFGTTYLDVPVQKTFTVTNNGDIVLTLTEPISVPTGYSVVSSFSSTSLAPSASATFTIQFDATAEGIFGGEISFVNTDDDESPFNFMITAEVERRKVYVPFNAGEDGSP